MDYGFFIKVFAALFAIMNPVANLPVFLALTDYQSAGQQRRTALVTVLAVTVSIPLVALCGSAVLRFFGISVSDFRLAGGLLIFMIALSMLKGEQHSSHHGSAREREDRPPEDNPAFYPLTMPILMGPGTISTLIIYYQQTTGGPQQTAFFTAALALVALLAAVFLSGPFLSRTLGQTAMSIMHRLMGMILAALAVGMVTSSLAVLLPGLAAG